VLFFQNIVSVMKHLVKPEAIHLSTREGISIFVIPVEFFLREVF